MENRERIWYLDYLRILSIFAVVLLHVVAQKWYSVGYETAEWQILNAYDSCVRWCVPVLVMISGTLFLDEKREITIKGLYTRSIFRIACAYLFWSFVYSADRLIGGVPARGALAGFVQGESHMWYMFMIGGLYMLVPLLRRITQSREMERYFLILGFCFTFLIPQTLDLFETLPATNEFFLLQPLRNVVGHTGFQFTLGYVYYFVLGHYLATAEIKRPARWVMYVLGIAAVVVTWAMSEWYANLLGYASEKYYGNFTMMTFAASVALFVFGKYVLSNVQPCEGLRGPVAHLSKYTFGIYLVHKLVLNKFASILGWNVLSFSPVVNVLVLTVAVFAVSYLISVLLGRIPLLRKYVV